MLASALLNLGRDHGRHIGVAVVCAVLGAACFYVPDIQPVPEEPDTPPFLLGFEPDLVIDLREPSVARFAVDAVYDLNDREEIDWVIQMYLTPDAIGPFPLESGTLRPREVQSFEDATEYQGPSAELDRCPLLAQARGDGDIITVDLVLTDPLPESQQREGFEEYSIRYSWRARVVGECDQ